VRSQVVRENRYVEKNKHKHNPEGELAVLKNKKKGEDVKRVKDQPRRGGGSGGGEGENILGQWGFFSKKNGAWKKKKKRD